MSDEEFDYMSDAFLTSPSQDIRPGLVLSRSIKRKNEISLEKEMRDKLNKEKHKPLKEIERESLKNGLEKPIDPTNKGFALLAKMGFKPGSGLGKGGMGCSEPVAIEVKTSREGLGVKAAREEKLALKERLMKEAQLAAPTSSEYLSRIIEETNERKAAADLRKSQKACHSLESAEGINEPLEKWYWPPYLFPEDEEEEEEEEEEEKEDISVQDKLQRLTEHLRRAYCYCIWCGTRFDDEKDLQQECPGPTRKDHD